LSVNRGRVDVGEPPTVGGDIPVLVDRQNLVAWRDMSDLSAANLAAIISAGQASDAKAVGAAPNPTTPKSPKSTEESPLDYLLHQEPFDHLAYRDSYEAHREARQARILEELLAHDSEQ
jgi:hypothetical protein